MRHVILAFIVRAWDGMNLSNLSPAPAETALAAYARHRTEKSIVLRFVGGCLDGRTVRSDAAAIEEAVIAMAYYYVTGEGTASTTIEVMPSLCSRLRGKSSGMTPGQYRVEKREENDRSVTVVLRHLEHQGWNRL